MSMGSRLMGFRGQPVTALLFTMVVGGLMLSLMWLQVGSLRGEPSSGSSNTDFNASLNASYAGTFAQPFRDPIGFINKNLGASVGLAGAAIGLAATVFFPNPYTLFGGILIFLAGLAIGLPSYFGAYGFPPEVVTIFSLTVPVYIVFVLVMGWYKGGSPP